MWAYSFESERVSTTQLFVFARAIRTWSQNKNPMKEFSEKLFLIFFFFLRGETLKGKKKKKF